MKQQQAQQFEQIVPKGEHFDYLEAIQVGEYYDKGIKFVIQVPANAEKQHLSRQILKTDSTEIALVHPIQFAVPEGKGKLGTLFDFLEEWIGNMQQYATTSAANTYIVQQMELMQQGQVAFTVQVQDPLGNAQVQMLPSHATTITSNDATDPHVTVTYYERSRILNRYYDIPFEHQVAIGNDAMPIALQYMKQAKKIVALTGAGISTESGVPAFRSADKNDTSSIWNKYKMEDTFYDNFVKYEHCRVNSWLMKSELYDAFLQAKANASHLLFAHLHTKLNNLHLIITQNIDELHQSVVPQDKVVELHGTVRGAHCMTCKHHLHGDALLQVVNQFKQLPPPITTSPRCPQCTTGILKFDTVAFGEPLDTNLLKQAQQAIDDADLLIVMGTSLVVAPANQLVTQALERQIKVILINIGETFVDQDVDVLLNQAKTGQICEQLINML